MSIATRISLFLAGLLSAGCSNTVAPDLLIEPIQIVSVDVQILESFPPQAVAEVSGILGDGCSEFHSLEQVRTGNTVTITILRQRPRDAICTQIAKLYDEDIRLTGVYPPGDYLLSVNGFEKPFVTE